jgi:hypothetical protein
LDADPTTRKPINIQFFYEKSRVFFKNFGYPSPKTPQSINYTIFCMKIKSFFLKNSATQARKTPQSIDYTIMLMKIKSFFKKFRRPQAGNSRNGRAEEPKKNNFFLDIGNPIYYLLYRYGFTAVLNL